MSDEPLIFAVPDNFPLRELKHWLAKNQPTRIQPPKDEQRAYLDTFDWRLFRAGGALEVTADKSGFVLTWRKLGSGQPLVQTRMRRMPRFAAEFVAPVIQRQLREIVGDRTLLPQVSVSSNTRGLSLMDDEEKTLVRVELRQDRVVIPNSTKSYKLPDYACLFGYRGYENVLRKKLRQLTGKGRLRPIGEDPLIAALKVLGIQPSDYSRKPLFQLDPDQPTYTALRQIVDAFRRNMEINIEGLCKDQDPEFLHDYMLALRRTRCLVGRFSSSFPIDGLNLIQQDFNWIDKVATPVRDLDIYLGLFDEFGARVDSEHRSALQPLNRFLKEQKLKEQRKMRVPLDSPRYHRLMNTWKRFLEQQLSMDAYPAEARRPILHTAGEHILEIYDEVLAGGRHISPDSPTKALLQLHQQCKLLGYQIEIFRSLYPGKAFNKLMPALHDLQQNLNQLHDLHLQQRALLDYRDKMQQERRTMPISLEAIDLLAADMADEYRKVRRAFDEKFQRLARNKTQKGFRSVFGQQPVQNRASS